ncbi:MAG: hypothetical protein NUW00_02495 [Candidatus Kaiserbacteria bacterium]|nr:hypothetical protein [Candidatus Kaiserbacteria bacterium]
MAKQIIRALVALLATSVLVACSSQPFGQTPNNTPAQPATAPTNSVALAVPKSSPASATNVASAAVDASKLASFQLYIPISAVKRGEGDGYAKGEFYRNRSLKEIVNLLKTPKVWAKEMNVSCETFVAQVRESHGFIDQGSQTCEGLATFLEREKVTVEDCTPEMFTTKHKLALKAGKGFSMWHRACKTDKKGKVEQVVMWKGVPLFSTFCMNIAVSAMPAVVAPQAPAPATTTTCPNPLVIRVNVWQPGVLEKVAGLKQAVEANKKDTTTNHFSPGNISRDWGDPILLAAKVGDAVRSANAYTYQVSIHKKGGGVVNVRTPPTITGEHTFLMPAEFTEGDVMRVDFADLSKFHSPTSAILARWIEFKKSTCGHRNNFHAIEW